MSEPITLYKLIVLYMLHKVDFPLTTSQISSFIATTLHFSHCSPCSLSSLRPA